MSDIGKDVLSGQVTNERHQGFFSKINPLSLLANELSSVTHKDKELPAHDTDSHKHSSLLSKINPLSLIANEIHAITNKDKAPVKLQSMRPKLAPIEQVYPDVSDTPDIPLVDHDINVKRDALRSFNVAEYLKHIPQLQATCGEIVQTIYNDKKLETLKEGKLATFHLPTHFGDQDKERLERLLTTLTEGRDILSTRYPEKDRPGMQKFYEESYGKYIEPSVAAMHPEFDESLKDFKAQVKLANKSSEKIKELGDKRQFAPQQLQTIAGEAIKIAESLYRATRPLKDLTDEPDLDLLDFQVKEKRNQQLEVRRRLEGAKPLQDRLDALKPFTKLALDIQKIDQSLTNISQETNTRSEYDVGFGKDALLAGPAAPILWWLDHQDRKANKRNIDDQVVKDNLKNLSSAIEDLKADIKSPELIIVEQAASRDPSAAPSYVTMLSTFHEDTTNALFSRLDGLQKICETGNKGDYSQLRKQIAEFTKTADYSELRSAYSQLRTYTKDLSSKRRQMLNGQMD